MKILWDCRSIVPCMGGIGRATCSWLNAFLGARPEHWSVVLLFSSACSPQWAKRLVPAFPKAELAMFAEAGLVAPRFEQLVLPNLLESESVDLYFNPCFTLPAIKTTRFQVSVVHDVVFFEHPSWVDFDLACYLGGGTDLAMKSADGVLTVSNFSRSRIQELTPQRDWPRDRNISLLQPSIAHLKEADLLTKPSSGQARAGGFILYLGAIETKKGLSLLLEAYAVLRKLLGSQCPPLVLAGGQGGQGYDLKQHVERLGLASHVIFRGFVPEEEKLALLVSASVFVFPSLYEGFGIPPLEAMRLGTPVVASNRTSLPEVLGDAAILIDPENREGLAEAMRRVLVDESLRDELRSKGRKQADKYAQVDVTGLLSLFTTLEEAA